MKEIRILNDIIVNQDLQQIAEVIDMDKAEELVSTYNRLTDELKDALDDVKHKEEYTSLLEKHLDEKDRDIDRLVVKIDKLTKKEAALAATE